jgi:hypothetical protein
MGAMEERFGQLDRRGPPDRHRLPSDRDRLPSDRHHLPPDRYLDRYPDGHPQPGADMRHGAAIARGQQPRRRVEEEPGRYEVMVDRLDS